MNEYRQLRMIDCDREEGGTHRVDVNGIGDIKGVVVFHELDVELDVCNHRIVLNTEKWRKKRGNLLYQSLIGVLEHVVGVNSSSDECGGNDQRFPPPSFGNQIEVDWTTLVILCRCREVKERVKLDR